jgi:hypothetical protein
MSAGDFYCEYCEDHRYIEVSEDKWVPCPHCNKTRDQKKDRRDYDDYQEGD